MVKNAQEALIVGACRTPIGSFLGALSPLSAVQLGSLVVEEALRRANVPKDKVDGVIMGNVLPAGLGQAPARQAALGAGLPTSVGCLTINKVCGSGLKAAMLGAQAIRAGDAGIIVAGGMESMSNAPYIMERARSGLKMGHAQLVDSMIKDGLWDAYNDCHMGSCGERAATTSHYSRKNQDDFAVMSYRRALDVQKAGGFEAEIVPVRIPQKKGDPFVVSEDEEPKKVDFNKIPSLKPAFGGDGTITAANASSINDGAAAVVLASSESVQSLGIIPLARVLAYDESGLDPVSFPYAPISAIEKALKWAGLTPDQIDLYEINEAFAVVTLAVTDKLGLDRAKVNVKGGAVALGHPIGASGARILTTLLYAMKERKSRYGCASLCIGGGEAVALIVECRY